MFKGTRVSIQFLFDQLALGITVDEFLDDFPTVSREQTAELLTIALSSALEKATA